MRSSIVFSSRFTVTWTAVVAAVGTGYVGSFTSVNARLFFCTFVIKITPSLPVAVNRSVATAFPLYVRSVGCIGRNFSAFGILSWAIYPSLCAGNRRSVFSTSIIRAVRMVVAIAIVVVIVTMVISIPAVIIVDYIVVAPTPVVAPTIIVPAVIVVTPAIVATTPVVPTIPSIPGPPAAVAKDHYYAIASVPIGVVP